MAHGRPIQGDFRDPRWETVADIEAHVGCHIKRWPAGIYTALAVAGEEAGRLRDEAAARTREAIRRLTDTVESKI